MGLYVIQKCAVSLDGFIDDISDQRLILSNAADFDRLDAIRAEVDAILVGAGTIRADNPSLMVKSKNRKETRLKQGRTESPIKITITKTGNLDSKSHFFAGPEQKLIYCCETIVSGLRERLGSSAEVVGIGLETVELEGMLHNLERRGIKKLLVEGGSEMGTLFLQQGLVDELQISIAPFFIGQPNAPRFVGGENFYHNQKHRMDLEKVEKVGDMALLTYRLSGHLYDTRTLP